MSRSVLIFVAIAALASCATVSGLADKEVVDCPGGCSDDGGAPTRDDATTNDGSSSDAAIDTGPPPCDPAKDDACLQLPAGGWTLVARAALGDSPPPCPTGFGPSTSVGESPTPKFQACTCDNCTVTAQASCAGKVDHAFSAAGGACGTPGSASYYTDPATGQCQTDMYTGPRSTAMNEFSLPSPSGGACTPAAPTVHSDRFNWSNAATLCDATTRCSQGICDARIDAPFAVCVAHDGVVDSCPAGFADRHVVGTQADADCTPTCGCSVDRAQCIGSISHYTDANCTAGGVTIIANGQCLGALNGTFLSYKVTASSFTSCDATGASTASNPRPKDPRTVCCR